VLLLAIREPVPHFDVHQTTSPSLVTWGPGLAYSRLLRFESGSGIETPGTQVVCDLCAYWEQTDPTTYRITLRSDARWQELSPLAGRRVTAADVAFSYARQATPGWPNAALLGSVDSITPLDESTIEFALRRPDAEFLENLADGRSKIVAPEAVAKSGDLLRGPTVGSGPWLLVEETPERFEFLANPLYYEQGLPYLDGLTVQVIPDGATRLSALLTGLLDVDQPGYEDLQRAVSRHAGLQWAAVRTTGVGLEVALNTGRAPLDSLGVRRAVLLAWAPWRYIDEIWAGQAFVSTGLRPPDPSWLLTELELRPYFADPDSAARLLQEAGVAAGTPLEITVGEYGDRYVTQATAMAEDLDAVGFDVSVKRVSTRVYGDDVWFGGDFQVLAGAQPPVAGLNDWLFRVHHSEGEWNTTGFSTPTLDDLIERQAAETDFAARRELVRRAQEQMLQGAHRFTAATAVSHWAWWPYVHGLAPNLARGESWFLADVWLSERRDFPGRR